MFTILELLENIFRIFIECNYMLKRKEKRDRFVRLAVKRVNRAIKDLRLIGNLSNRSVYEYTDEDARKIIKALQKELDTIRARFSSTGEASENEFSL
jgi:predicted membrane protein